MSEEQRGAPGSPARSRPVYLPAALAFAASQSALVISTKPLPLQEFWPLQELLALLQADWPLQEFTPVHFTFASSAVAFVTAAIEKIIAAAAARATLDIFREFIRVSPRTLGTHSSTGKGGIAPGDWQAPGRGLYA